MGKEERKSRVKKRRGGLKGEGREEEERRIRRGEEGEVERRIRRGKEKSRVR